MSRISQREARRMRKRLTELESAEQARRNAWIGQYPGGVNICSYTGWLATHEIPVAVQTARKLGHAVVVTVAANGDLMFFALPLGRVRS